MPALLCIYGVRSLVMSRAHLSLFLSRGIKHTASPLVPRLIYISCFDRACVSIFEHKQNAGNVTHSLLIHRDRVCVRAYVCAPRHLTLDGKLSIAQ